MARRSQLCRPVTLSLALLFPSLRASTQPAPQSSVPAAAPATVHLAGTVINGVTGRPIARALVVSTDNRLATLTNSEGRFSFDLTVSSGQPSSSRLTSFSGGVGSPNTVALRAQKPGYLPDEDISPASLSSASIPDLEIRLMPAAVITGRISATTTDSAGGVPVMLLKHQVEDGIRNWTQVGAQTTSSRGVFRFADLRPGEYTVATAEWRGDRPVSPDPGAITEQYPPVFLGDTPALSPGAVLHLHFGDTAQADLHLRLAAYYPVVIPVRSADPMPWVGAEIHGADDLSRYQLGYDARTGEVTGALPSGRYSITLSGPPPPSTATIPIQVANAALRTAPVTLSPSGTITVRVRREFTRETATDFNVNLTLRPETPGRGYAGGGNQPGNREEFALNNTYPGRFRVTLTCAPGYVSAATSGGVDLLREPLVVGPNGTADPIQITLRDDGATVTGTVHPETGPAPSHSFVLLVPSGTATGFQEAYAGPDGNFTMSNVPPGTYRLLAFRAHPTAVAFREPETMRVFAGEGATVSATPGATAHIDVPLEDKVPEEQ